MSKNVATKYGKLAGEEVAGVHVFRGVPFARPPLGALRFAPPQPPARWRGIREALRAGPAPLQVGASWMTRMRLDVGGRVDEDCLYLNVYTPGIDAARRPVLVFLHGGAFLMGAGSTALYDGRRLARRSGIVVVTTNYRLGALGWAHLGLVPGSTLPDAVNLGLQDQTAALAWVRDNIAEFGGDPGNVTLCGQSAGAMSAAALCASAAGAHDVPARDPAERRGAQRDRPRRGHERRAHLPRRARPETRDGPPAPRRRRRAAAEGAGERVPAHVQSDAPDVVHARRRRLDRHARLRSRRSSAARSRTRSC